MARRARGMAMRSEAAHFLQTNQPRHSMPMTVPPRAKPSRLVFASSSNMSHSETPRVHVISVPRMRARHRQATRPRRVLRANLCLLMGLREKLGPGSHRTSVCYAVNHLEAPVRVGPIECGGTPRPRASLAAPPTNN
jgi:hypothetical protein